MPKNLSAIGHLDWRLGACCSTRIVCKSAHCCYKEISKWPVKKSVKNSETESNPLRAPPKIIKVNNLHMFKQVNQGFNPFFVFKWPVKLAYSLNICLQDQKILWYQIDFLIIWKFLYQLFFDQMPNKGFGESISVLDQNGRIQALGFLAWWQLTNHTLNYNLP